MPQTAHHLVLSMPNLLKFADGCKQGRNFKGLGGLSGELGVIFSPLADERKVDNFY